MKNNIQEGEMSKAKLTVVDAKEDDVPCQGCVAKQERIDHLSSALDNYQGLYEREIAVNEELNRSLDRKEKVIKELYLSIGQAQAEAEMHKIKKQSIMTWGKYKGKE